MKRTPEELLEETLTKLGVTKSELGRRFGSKQPYQLVHKWTKGQGFNERNQRATEDFLGLPRGFFQDEDKAAAHLREAYRARVLEEFLATELGTKATEAEVRVLGSIRFLDDLLPTAAFFASTLLALKHCLSPDEVAEVLQRNAELREAAELSESERA